MSTTPIQRGVIALALVCGLMFRADNQSRLDAAELPSSTIATDESRGPDNRRLVITAAAQRAAPRIPAPAQNGPVYQRLGDLDDLDEPLQFPCGDFSGRIWAEAPLITSPIGIAVDAAGNVLVIESHTHFPGPEVADATDRIVILRDDDDDGRADSAATLVDGLTHALGLAVHPDGALYAVTRAQVLRIANGRVAVIATLETDETYPHTGLAGLAFDRDGNVLWSVGENRARPWTLRAADGTHVAGDTGCVFRCGKDGRGLRQVARGFWNPFALCVDESGRIWVADNDPNCHPPCRLLHVVEGGDYGYRAKYGSDGRHPFNSLNGELPGTLPMAAIVGEGPSGIVALDGRLLVTSWLDKRIERFELAPRGYSFAAAGETCVQGSRAFRPSGIAIAPSGAIFVADWVANSYAVHPYGRIWKLHDKLPARPRIAPPPLLPAADLVAVLTALQSADPFEVHVARSALRKLATPSKLRELLAADSAPHRLQALLVLRDLPRTETPAELPRLIVDADPRVRLAAAVWAGEEKLAGCADALRQSLRMAESLQEVDVALAALALLGDSAETVGREQVLLELVRDSAVPVETRRRALRMISPAHPDLTLSLLTALLDEPDDSLRLEAMRSLRESPHPEKLELLLRMADDDSLSARLRAEARVSFDERDSLPSAWTLPAGDGPGDADAGERLFFHPRGPGCYKCHTMESRGGNIGPDLSRIGRNRREQVVDAILEPSKSIAPQYATWVVAMRDGKSFSGVLQNQAMHGTSANIESYGLTTGGTISISSLDVEERRLSTTSTMPQGLQQTMTAEEFRDLVAYLMSKR